MTKTTSAGLIIRQKEPVNLETPLDQADSYLTPTELFYIRSHFPAPRLELASYRLRIDGAVTNPLSLTYQQLRDMPSETRVATLECAGNSRVFLVPQVAGAQWELGAVGNAEWTGVPLATLLGRAGLEEDACEIVLEGADRGTPTEAPVPPGPISYARSLPRDKALQWEVLIAYQMNGRDLPLDHGYPVRAVVPGHYGMASVKWLTHVHAVREPFRGLLADIGLRILGLSGWEARAARVGRDEAEVRDRPTTGLRDACPEPGLHAVRRCVGGRDRGHGDRGEHGRGADLGRGRIPRPRSTACVAALEV
jgi:DMSO/TMAO reductase YedYZ molybdopterin-dependent catalytic subunit